MARVTLKRFDRPDEIHPFVGKGRSELLHFGDTVVSRLIFEPGWSWQAHEKPLVSTDSCQVHHTVFVLSGRMRVVMDDGAQTDLRAGDAVDIPPGHDGWVLGEEPCVMLAFIGAEEFAQAMRGQSAGAVSEPPHLTQ